MVLPLIRSDETVDFLTGLPSVTEFVVLIIPSVTLGNQDWPIDTPYFHVSAGLRVTGSCQEVVLDAGCS
jgi:hypothetical protein